jgi:hypothetical protein
MLAGVGMGIWLIVESYSPVPYLDFWGELPFLGRVLDGHIRIADFWAQLNEHRIVVPRLAFVLDYTLFHGQYVFLFSLIALSCLLVACVLAGVVWIETADGLVTWQFFCVAAIAMLSPAAIENLTFAMQVGFPQVFLFGLIAIFALLQADRAGGSNQRRRRVWVIASAFAAIAATYSLANGLLLWPLLIALAVGLRVGRWATAVLAGVGAVTIFSYMWHFERVSGHARYGESLGHPLAVAKYVAVYIGNPVRQGGYAAEFVGVIGVALFALLALISWRRRASRSMTTVCGATLAFFVLCTAAETAMGRLNFGLAQALSSRYVTGSLVFWLSLLMGFLTPFLDWIHFSPTMSGAGRRLSTFAFFGVAAGIGIALSLRTLPDEVSIRETVLGKELTVLAFRVGVEDPAIVTGLPPGDPAIVNGLRWLRRERLGPWAPGGMVDGSRFTLHAATLAPMCRGRIELIEPVEGGLRLRGWIVPPGDEPASHQLAVLSGRGIVSGLGVVGMPRRDVPGVGAAPPNWAGLTAYVRGRPRTPLRIVLIAADHARPLCLLDEPSQRGQAGVASANAAIRSRESATQRHSARAH